MIHEFRVGSFGEFRNGDLVVGPSSSCHLSLVSKKRNMEQFSIKYANAPEWHPTFLEVFGTMADWCSRVFASADVIVHVRDVEDDELSQVEAHFRAVRALYAVARRVEGTIA